MGRTAPLLIALITMGVTAVPETGAARCRLCETPATRAEAASGKDVQLEIETSLDFDRLVLLGSGQGSALLRPDGSRTVSGSVASMSGRAMVGSAVVRGEAGRAIRINLPRRIELYSLSGNRITIEEIASNLPAMPRLDASGSLSFRFGGRLRVAGDAEGDYKGDIPITVEYL